MAELIVVMLFMLFSIHINGLKTGEYGTYWLTDFQQINNWAHTKKDFSQLFFLLRTNKKGKQTSIMKN